MTEKLDRGRQQSLVVPEYFAKILKNKDRIIRVQAKRIEILEGEVQRLRLAREAMSSQLAVLSYKLQAVSNRNEMRNKTECNNQNRMPGLQTRHVQPLVLDAIQVRINSNSYQSKASEAQRSPMNLLHNGGSVELGNDRHKVVATVASYFASSADAEVERFEQKYGDYHRANQAALKIQQMYRQYSLNRNFEKLRLEVGDSSRRSRRFNKLVAENNLKIAAADAQRNNKVMAPNSGLDCPHQKSNDFENNALTKEKRICRNSDHHSPIHDSVDEATDRKVNSSVSEKLQRQHSAKSFSEEKDMQQIASDSDRNSLTSPTGFFVDLPSFNFESLLESRRRNPSGFLDDGNRDGAWSSSSSSSKVSTPVDPLPVMTYTDEDCVKNSDDFGDYTRVFKSRDANGDLNSPQRTLISSVSYDCDNVFISTQQKTDLYPSDAHVSAVDGNCLRVALRPDKSTHGQSTSLGKSLCSNSYGHCKHEGKLTKEHSHRCCNTASHPGNPRLHLAHLGSENTEPSPIWKRKSVHEASCGMVCNSTRTPCEAIDMEGKDTTYNASHEPVLSSSNSDVASLGSSNDIKIPSEAFNAESSSGEYELYVPHSQGHLSDKQKKRKYRIGLNVFNRKPEKGIRFLIENHFLDSKPRDVARFLLTRKGLSKQMIGEFLGNLLQQFNMDVLESFVNEIDLRGIPIDKALRKFQSHFRMPGEAQKIEKLMEAFASSYISYNPDVVRKFTHPDTVFLIAYAIIMLNTDLHNNNIKPDRKMKLQDFIRNLRGIDGGEDVDPQMLTEIFDRIAAFPLKSANDHVMQVMKVEKMILGKKPQLAVPHRRLICYCRLFEVKDPSKREKSNLHQREVFLFNDLLLITKLNNKKKDSLLYNYRESFPLFGMMMVLFELPYYKHGVQLTSNLDNRVFITLCASNEADRMKFVEDLNEAIMEVNEMEAMRIQEDLMSQNLPLRNSTDLNRYSKDSGIVDLDPNRLLAGMMENRLSAPDCTALNKGSLSHSTGDMVDGRHLSSSGSLDSGLPSVNSGSSSSFQDKTAPKLREASKFNIFTRKPKASRSSTTDPS